MRVYDAVWNVVKIIFDWFSLCCVIIVIDVGVRGGRVPFVESGASKCVNKFSNWCSTKKKLLNPVVSAWTVWSVTSSSHRTIEFLWQPIYNFYLSFATNARQPTTAWCPSAHHTVCLSCLFSECEIVHLFFWFEGIIPFPIWVNRRERETVCVCGESKKEQNEIIL